MIRLWARKLALVCSYAGLVVCLPALADAQLAIIIDDIGYNKTQSERAARLKGNFTLSILPFTPHGLNSAKLARSQGKELMLHLPMSTISNIPIGKGGLVSGMEKGEFISVLQQDLDSMPFIQGVNNHMGSGLTQEAEPMTWLMSELKKRGLYFVDSRTSAKTKALDIAKSTEVPSIKRDVFLDDINDEKAIRFQLNRAIVIAQEHGSALAIGHPYPATLSVLEDIQPLLADRGVKLVYASTLIKPSKNPVRLEIGPSPVSTQHSYCPAPAQDFLTKLSTGVDLYDKSAMMISPYFGY